MEKTENEISYDIRACAYKIHKQLGPGLLELVYEAAMCYELQLLGYKVECQKGIGMNYEDIKFELGFRVDILVNNLVIIEIKSVEKINNVHCKKLLTYLKLSSKKLGLLINFNVSFLTDKESIIRIVNEL